MVRGRQGLGLATRSFVTNRTLQPARSGAACGVSLASASLRESRLVKPTPAGAPGYRTFRARSSDHAPPPRATR